MGYFFRKFKNKAKKILVSICCWFIPFSKSRKNFRKKFLDNYRGNCKLSLNKKTWNKILKPENFQLQRGNFLLFDYEYPKYSENPLNIGDYLQTLAVKNALDAVFHNNNYSFFDRDNLTNYNGPGRILCVMQGWFSHTSNFLPNNKILPVYVGTHFCEKAHNLLESVFNSKEGKTFTQNLEIGCRDNFTLEFCRKNSVNSYLSRCLTLTFRKRSRHSGQNKIFTVEFPEELHSYLPREIKENTEYISHYKPGIRVDGRNCAQTLLNRYRDEAKLVITDKLHCASPCIAMGIPVVLIKTDSEQSSRFSTLDNIIKIYEISDLKNRSIDYDAKVLDIEDLKKDMLANLELSVKKATGENVDLNELAQIRSRIASFSLF